MAQKLGGELQHDSCHFVELLPHWTEKVFQVQLRLWLELRMIAAFVSFHADLSAPVSEARELLFRPILIFLEVEVFVSEIFREN